MSDRPAAAATMPAAVRNWLTRQYLACPCPDPFPRHDDGSPEPVVFVPFAPFGEFLASLGIDLVPNLDLWTAAGWIDDVRFVGDLQDLPFASVRRFTLPPGDYRFVGIRQTALSAPHGPPAVAAGRLVRVLTQENRTAEVDLCRCEPIGPAVRPDYLHTTPHRLGSEWLVNQLRVGAGVELYRHPDGVFLAVNPALAEGVTLNPNQFDDVRVRLATTTTTAAPRTTVSPLPEAQAALLRVLTNGIADDRVRDAVQVIVNERLTVNEKLAGIDELIRIPATASAAQLGDMLGVTKQAVIRSQWWTDNRKGEKASEIGRRHAGHQKRAGLRDTDRTDDDD